MKTKKWEMPDWMEKYRDIIVNTGGNSIEDCMNRNDVNIFNNAPLALIQSSVQSQVTLLILLKATGDIK